MLWTLEAERPTQALLLVHAPFETLVLTWGSWLSEDTWTVSGANC
eukprot:gene11006-biopygen15835